MATITVSGLSTRYSLIFSYTLAHACRFQCLQSGWTVLIAVPSELTASVLCCKDPVRLLYQHRVPHLSAFMHIFHIGERCRASWTCIQKKWVQHQHRLTQLWVVLTPETRLSKGDVISIFWQHTHVQQTFFDIGLVFTDNLPCLFFVGVLIDKVHCRAEFDRTGKLCRIDNLDQTEHTFQLFDAAFDETLLFACGMVFGVFLEVAQFARLGNRLNDSGTLF